MERRSRLIKNVKTPIMIIWKIPPEMEDTSEVELWKRFLERDVATEEREEIFLCMNSKNVPKSRVLIYDLKNGGNPSASIPPAL